MQRKKLSDIHDHVLRIVRRYYPFLAETAGEDLRQIVWLAVLEHPNGPLHAIRQAAVRHAERLARDLGWRRTRDAFRRRVWMREADWLHRGPRRQGAPVGNRNAARCR